MSLTIEYESQGPRGAFRTTLPGLMLRLPAGQKQQIKDLSAGGLSFMMPRAETVLVQGVVIRTDLLIADKVYLENLSCRIVRITDAGMVAMAFDKLSRQQEARLDKLVLEIQKRLIAQRKMKDQEYAASADECNREGAYSAPTLKLDAPNID